MRFVESWLPIVVVIRQGRLEATELSEMAEGFERLFQRGTMFSVLSLSELQAPAMDALARQRLADWNNQPRIQSLSKQFCAGSATVVAREDERRALTALLWLWTPAAPHDVVHTISRGIEVCLTRLLERQVTLPVSSEAFRHQIQRGVSNLPVAGLKGPATRLGSHSARPRSGQRLQVALEKLSVGNGQVIMGWVATDVLWASFHGHLSPELAELYARRLAELLRRGQKAVSYFGDASGIENFDLMGRTVALRALILRLLPHWPSDRYLELAPKSWALTRAKLAPKELEAPIGPITVPAA